MLRWAIAFLLSHAVWRNSVSDLCILTSGSHQPCWRLCQNFSRFVLSASTLIEGAEQPQVLIVACIFFAEVVGFCIPLHSFYWGGKPLQFIDNLVN
jgi:hypothetical protein